LKRYGVIIYGAAYKSSLEILNITSRIIKIVTNKPCEQLQ